MDELEQYLKWGPVLLALVSLLAGGVTYQSTQDAWQAAKIALVFVVIALVFGFVLQVGKRLNERWSVATADKIDAWLRGSISGFQKRYLQHLVYRHRDFDVKGLSTQGIYTLELEQVFVELSVAPQASHLASADLVRAMPQQLQRGSHTIWDYLDSDPGVSRRLAVIGPPGSGKTTLLKHITLSMTADRKYRRDRDMPDKLPILLFLRDHAQTIVNKPDVLLPELVQSTLVRWQLEAPPQWLEAHLKKGRCMVMLDGLDEVADSMVRHRVVRWAERQIHTYPKNHFLITSRPFGYRDNPLGGVTVLEVAPFNNEQIRHFVSNWYLANEIKSAQMDDPGVRMKAREGADDLLMRLHNTPTLMELAVNPLLLTMIATVHRYRSSLPGRRVELYKEICEVFLGKRQLSKGLDLDLTPAQKQSVLQPLAYHMMCQQQREIETPRALDVIAERLRLVSPQGQGDEFLRAIENSSGLLLERESGVYGFAHKTFQEYLASVHILEQNLVDEIIKFVDEDWWHECIRLYAAQTDATRIIEACLAEDPPTSSALTLAIACEDEARQVQPEVRARLEQVLYQGVETPYPDRMRIVAEALLNLRMRRMVRVSANQYIDRNLITHAEYQLFLNEMYMQGEGYHPDHWSLLHFPAGQGLNPAVGVRASDAQAYCDWLRRRDKEDWSYRLPTTQEAGRYQLDSPYAYWLAPESASQKYGLHIGERCKPASAATLKKQVARDFAIARKLSELLGIDAKRALLDARLVVEDINHLVSKARPTDLEIDGSLYLKSDWTLACNAANRLMQILDGVRAWASKNTVELTSLGASRLAMSLVEEIRRSRDELRVLVLPGVEAPERANKRAAALSRIRYELNRLNQSVSFERDARGIQDIIAARAMQYTGDLIIDLVSVVELVLSIKNPRILTFLETYTPPIAFDLPSAFRSDHTRFPDFQMAVRTILDRDPHRRTESKRESLSSLMRWYLRANSILAIEILSARKGKQVAPFLTRFVGENLDRHKTGELIDGYRDDYAVLAILEARIRGEILAAEGLRIVREREAAPAAG